MQSKEIQSLQDQSALERYVLIAPLLDDALDTAAKTKLCGEISKYTYQGFYSFELFHLFLYIILFYPLGILAANLISTKIKKGDIRPI